MRPKIAMTLPLAICALAACSDELPAGATQVSDAPTPAEAPAPAPVEPVPFEVPPPDAATPGGELTWTVPEGWIEDEPENTMRRAQYRLPGPDGDAGLVVFYFGPGQGGTAMANADRWIGQFRRADGSPLGNDDVILSDRLLGETPILVVEARGTFIGSAMPGRPEQQPLADHMLLGAVVRGPDANWFFKALGPAATLESHRERFDELLQSIR